MFGIGPEKLLLLAAVGFVLLGPQRMPELIRDAARMLRTLRDLSGSARGQLTAELGPEFAHLGSASLNPRTALRNALMGDATPVTDQVRGLPRQYLASLEDAPVAMTPEPIPGEHEAT